MEVATVFLETSLGTRLAVSFPAATTTVADLKRACASFLPFFLSFFPQDEDEDEDEDESKTRRVSDEHAAAFPHIGPIAVQAIKVKQGGSLYLLTDSMAVRDAFQGVTGAWHLQLQLHALPRPHSALPQQMPQLPPHACNCKHSSRPSVPIECECEEGSPTSRSRSFAAALGCRKRSVCEMLTHQQAALEATHTESESERAPPPREKLKKRPAAADSDFDFGLLSVSVSVSVHKEPCSSSSSIAIAGNMCNAANTKQDAPCVEQLNHVGHPCSQMRLEEKGTWTSKEADPSQQEAMQQIVEEKELLTAKVCNGQGSNQGTDHPPPPPCAAVSTKEGDSLENEAMQCKVDENEPLTARAVCNDERDDNGTHLPPPCAAEFAKEGNSSEKQAMQHKTEEKEPSTAKVCNHESSNNETDLPPPRAAKSTKEGDSSSEKEAMTRQVEEKEPLAANVCDHDESNKETDHPSPCAAKSTKEGDSSSEEEAIKHKVEEKVCNSESSSNWTDPSPGDGSMNEADSSENEVMQHEAEEKEPWTDSVCKGGGSSHWNDPIEWTDAEQRAWEMALKKRRRPRTAVRKMPNSRAAKLYGYS